MDIYDYKEMIETEGERHTVRNMRESGMSDKEINTMLDDIYSMDYYDDCEDEDY